MPVIPLKQLSYDDAKDLRRVIDAINANFRYLDWLVNHGNLDTANIKPEIIQVLVPIDPEKQKPVDEFGINPEYLKFYPNKCYNSGFEVFDPTTLKPKYWDTDGAVSTWADFDDTHSLKLAPGQYAEQKEESGEGLADPGWWPWCPETRISFRVKGEGGKVRVQVIQAGLPVNLWQWIKSGEDMVKSNPAPYLELGAAPDWPVALRTFAAQTSASGGKIKLRFENTGSVDVYIDAVTIEPDWTGRWPSFYTHGPKSAAVVGGDTYLEYGLADWSAAGVEFVLVNGYIEQPVVTVSVQGDPAQFSSAAFVLVVKHVQETIGGQLCYSKVQVYPKGTSVPSLSGAKISMLAVCTGVVKKPNPV